MPSRFAFCFYCNPDCVRFTAQPAVLPPTPHVALLKVEKYKLAP